MNNTDPIKCLKAIQELVGGRPALAEKLDVSVHTISKWIVNKKIPFEKVFLLAEISQGRFTSKDLKN